MVLIGLFACTLAVSRKQLHEDNSTLVARLRTIKSGQHHDAAHAPIAPLGSPSKHALKGPVDGLSTARSGVIWAKQGAQLPSLQLLQDRRRVDMRIQEENMRIAAMLCECKPHYARGRLRAEYSHHKRHVALASKTPQPLTPLAPLPVRVPLHVCMDDVYDTAAISELGLLCEFCVFWIDACSRGLWAMKRTRSLSPMHLIVSTVS